MVVAPNFSLSSIIWDYVTDLIKNLQIEIDKFNQKEKNQKKMKVKKDREQIVKEASSWGVNASKAVFDSWLEEDDLDQVALLFFLTNFIDDLLFTGCPASNIQMCLAKGFEMHEERD